MKTLRVLKTIHGQIYSTPSSASHSISDLDQHDGLLADASHPRRPLAAYESPGITAEDLERLKHELGLDVPIHIQYWNWLMAIVRGNWGTSIVSGRPVLTEISERIFNTLYLSYRRLHRLIINFNSLRRHLGDTPVFKN